MAVKCPKCQTDNPSDSKYCKECATPLPSSREIGVSQTETLVTPREELATGSIFADRYQVIEELGHGGMGKVYKVFDRETNSKVALKLIRPEVAADKNTIERFRNELKVARDISHNHICRMYDLGREADNYFITMEFVSGEDLRSLIRRTKRLDIATAISIAKQVCEGLAEAHRLGVVHRDLKPSNVMIDREGDAKIMDFGIARSLRTKGITGPGVVIGTPEYMSPEQVDGKEADQRADLYSLSIILYEMVTGKVPFEGETAFAIGLKHKSEPPENPRKLNPLIPDDLSGLILKGLEKDKENRYQSARDLLEALNKFEVAISSTERAMLLKETVMPKEGIMFSDKNRRASFKYKLFIAIVAILPALITFLLVSNYYTRKALKTDSANLKPTLSGRPLASYRFYPLAVSPEGSAYIDKDLFMDAVNSLRENPDARAVADLIYLERKNNFTLQLGESDRKLFQDLVEEVPVPDATDQEKYIDRLFIVYKQIVDGIGQTFAGTPIEIVLHDTRNPMRSIQALQNPISGRQLYQPTTNFGIELTRWYAKHPQQGSNFISYNLALADGTPIKSSTIPLYDPEYGLLGSICLNIRISDISETILDKKTKQFLAAFRRTSSNLEIEEIIDNTKKNRSQKPSDK